MTPHDPAGVRTRVIQCIDDYWRDYYMAPSLADLAYCAKVSKSTAYKVLDDLELAGLILPRDGGVARGIVPMWVKDAIDAENGV